MDYVDFDEELQRLNEAREIARAYTLCEMKQVFPDLRLVRDHFGQIKLCSTEANDQVDTLEIDSCHNCDGAPLKAWAYVVVDKQGTRLYSDPPCFIVADQNPDGFGEIPRQGWLELLQSHRISRFAIAKVKDHLERHPPISYLEAEDGDPEADPGTDD